MTWTFSVAYWDVWEDSLALYSLRFKIKVMFGHKLRYGMKVTFGHELCYEIKVTFGEISLKLRQTKCKCCCLMMNYQVKYRRFIAGSTHVSRIIN